MASSSAIHDTIPRFEIRHFEKVRVIGVGGFGKVVLYKNKKTSERGQHELVVMKHLLSGYLHQQDLERLKQEARILWKLDCEFVISLKSLCFNDQEFCIVMQYAQNGSCFDFFRHLRSSIDSEEKRNMLWPLKIRIAWQVIQAMKFLHGHEPNKILHLDLKAANVLLDEDYQAKVCDFGLAQMEILSTLSRTIAAYQGEGPALDNCDVKGHLRGTISHIAPEHLVDPNRRATEKSDSYSFGIFLWELLTNKVPYSDAMNPQVLMEAVKDPKVKLRPNCNEIPKGSPNLLIDMMSNSWSHEPQRRPDFQVLDRMFESDYAVYEPQVDASVQFVKSVQISSPNSSTTSGYTTAAPSAFIRRNAPALMRTSAAGYRQDWTSMHTLPDVNWSNIITMDSVPEDRAPDHRFEYYNSDSSTTDNEQEFSATPIERQTLLQRPHSPQQDHQQATNVKEKKGCINTKCLLWTIPTLLLLLTGLIFLSMYLVNHRSFCFLTTNCAPQAPRRSCTIDDFYGGKLICNENNSGQVKVGTRCNVTCDVGFQLVQPPSRECLNNNLWSQPASKCVKTPETTTATPREACKVEEMDGGKLICNGAEFGRVEVGITCKVSCNSGFQLVGPSSRVCLNDNKWSQPASKCVRSRNTTTAMPRETCKIQEIDGGQLICNGVEFWQVEVGTTCTVTCDSGFQLVGYRSRECLYGGIWSRSTSKCLRRCPMDKVPSDLTQMCSDGRLTGSECTFKCEAKKQVEGPASRTCEADGHWSNLFPKCDCEGCYDGLNCKTRLTWSALSAQFATLKKDKRPVQIKYGERLITCESVAKIWFVRYQCTCSDSKYNRRRACTFANRRNACRHALAALLRDHISQNEYKAPCDIGSVPSEC